eukprot:TRINITY_DN2056_c0_g1_i5.p1 TRINITY_DN2056_c0_g1~~TRINITY_DN2056_c0_g1_i5.p1  ORF type:complete len:365 (+),score=126.34 TRINITY_DN2056_c0_g1_i5:101-1195(+)
MSHNSQVTAQIDAFINEMIAALELQRAELHRKLEESQSKQEIEQYMVEIDTSQVVSVLSKTGMIVKYVDSESESEDEQEIVEYGAFRAALTQTYGKKAGAAAGDLNAPRSIALLPGGSVLVGESQNHRLSLFDRHGNFVRHIGSSGSENGQLQNPWGFSVDTQNQVVYIADWSNNRVVAFDLEGNFLRKIGCKFLRRPSSVFLARSGHLYVAESDSHRVSVWSTDGEFVRSFGSKGTKPGQLRSPSSVVVDYKSDPEGVVYVSEASNHRISAFDTQGNFLRTFGGYGCEEGMLQYPSAVVVGPKDGLLYVAEESGARVSVFRPSGTFVRCILSGQVTRPQSLCVTEKGQVYVAEGSLHRVSMWT